MTENKKILIAGIAVVALMAFTAAAASYITTENVNAQKEEAAIVRPKKQVARSTVSAPRPVSPQPQTQQVAYNNQPRCNDGNVLGTVAGGLAGGVVGSQVGKGSGKTAATIGGTLGGAYLGNQFIPLHNATCR